MPHTLPNPDETVLTVTGIDTVEVIRIAADGRTFWRGKEIDTDEQFKATMIDVAVAMRAMSDPRFPPEYIALRNQNVAMHSQILRLQEERVRLLERIEVLTNAHTP